MREYLPLFFLLILLAVLVRDDSIVTLLYLLAGTYFAGRWWSQRALNAVTFRRTFTDRAFPGEQVHVRLGLANSSWLPVVWLRLRDSVPPDLAGHRALQDVISLGPRGRVELDYTLQTYKRGYYRIGPLMLSSGDLLGLDDEQQREGPADHLIVYPQVVPLTRLGLPSRSPLGTLRHTQPIFEDPARVSGKRDYVGGDSLRRLDWKATAAAGRLQVKQFDPSIALETVLLLNLRAADYDLRVRYDATELAIVVAASIANWLVGRKQPAGLITNGLDPLSGRAPASLPARKGRGQLMRVLEVLARVQLLDPAPPLADVLRDESVRLPWGTTVVAVTGAVDEALVEALLQARRAGLNGVLILVGATTGLEAARRLERFGVTVHSLWHERDLKVWRQ